MHCSLRLIVQTLVFSRSYLHCQVSPPETLVVKGGITWAKMASNLDRKLRLPRIHFRVLLHTVNMRHRTNGFTSLPKVGVLGIFSAFRPGLNPRIWVPKASTLPLDHRSRLSRRVSRVAKWCVIYFTGRQKFHTYWNSNFPLGLFSYLEDGSSS